MSDYLGERNTNGKPKGVKQLVNFMTEFSGNRYDEIFLNKKEEYILYPILVTQDFTFTLPGVYSYVLKRYNEVLREENFDSLRLQIKPITLVDLDSIIKFQDLFISKKLTLNHVLNDYQQYLKRGLDDIEKSLSFKTYLEDKTRFWSCDSPKMFWTEVNNVLFSN